MVTYAGYVILTLTAVSLVAAWPQHRSTQATNRDDDEYDRVVWGSEDVPYMKRISTPANSPNIPRPTAMKTNPRRSERLQTGFQLEQENDTRPQQQQQQTRAKSRGAQANQDSVRQQQQQHQQQQQQQQQQPRGKSREVQVNEDSVRQQQQRNNNATGRGIQLEQVGAARQSNRTTQRSVVAVSSRGLSSQQESGRPSFQPRAHQTPVNRTRQASEGRETAHAQIGGSGGKTTVAPRGAVGDVMTETDGSREMVPEGRGLPEVRNNGSRDDIEVAASQDAGARSRHVDPSAAERNLPRWESNKGTRVKLPSENIVFPGPSHDDKHMGYNRHFIPSVVGKRPRCASNSTFCEDISGDYPVDHLNRILEQQSVVFRNFFSTDVVPEANNISQRFDDAQDDSPICVSETHVVFPKVAQNKDNDWLYIVNLNDEMYKQGVRIEKCRNPDQPCAYSEGFPQTVQTFCKQKYIYRQMLAVTQDGTPKPDAFKLPSCCACHTMSLGDAVSRMGVDPNRQSPAIATRRKKRRS